MSTTQTTTARTTSPARYVLLGLLILFAFFASYRFALAAGGDAGGAVSAPATLAAAGASDPASPACACCGTGGSSTPIEGAATVDADGVQRITVDTSTGSYAPNIIKLTAGVPAEITFKQAGGCLAQVMSQPLGFFEDISTGDKTVKLDGLDAGSYDFSCGMQMVFGQIVVE
jgi:hypothetical protein